MASRLVSVSKNIFGKAFYSNIWIAISFGLISQVIGYTKYEGYFNLYWIIMKDGYLYFNLYPSFDELSAILFIRVFLAVFVFLTIKDKLKVTKIIQEFSGDVMEYIKIKLNGALIVAFQLLSACNGGDGSGY